MRVIFLSWRSGALFLFPEDGEDSEPEPEPEPEPVKPVSKKFADSKKPSVGGFAGAKGGGSIIGKKGK